MSQEPLRAEYFVTRKDGKMVPLVAVDELPHHITIEGVSRVMSPFDIAGMTCVGRSSFRHRTYIVQEAPELAASNKAPGHDSLKAKYFITRDSGNMVPLVAMDEMPEFFAIKSVPRAVTVFEIAGMTCVGLGEVRDLVHTVEDVNNAPFSYFTERIAAEDASGEVETPSSAPTIEMEVLSLANRSTTTNEQTPVLSSANKTIVATPHASLTTGYLINTPPPQTQLPSIQTYDLLTDQEPIFTSPPLRSPSTIPSTRTMTPGVKEYCSYWLRHGECDYQQQGCLYKHEMPLDQDTLTRLGLRDIPRWYREKHALGSYLAAGGSGAAFSGESLKSAAASGLQEDDKSSRMSSNWRSGSRSGFRSPTSNERRNSNIYSPRSSRFAMDPSSFSRLPPNTPPGFPFHTRVRSGDNIHRRQQYQTHQALKNIERNTPPGRAIPLMDEESIVLDDADISASDATSEIIPLSRRRSTSTILSDIEALVGRQDAARRAKEDADYAKVVAEHNAKAGENVKPAPSAPKGSGNNGNNNGGRRGSGAGRRKNRAAPRRGAAKQPDEKPAAST